MSKPASGSEGVNRLNSSSNSISNNSVSNNSISSSASQGKGGGQ